MTKKRNYWGWGYTNFEVPEENMKHFKMMMKGFLQLEEFDPYEPVEVDDLNLRKPRVKLPQELEWSCSSRSPQELRHARKQYRPGGKRGWVPVDRRLL